MGNIFRNSSGCYDPTAGQAISNVLKEQRQEEKERYQKSVRNRPLVYICSAYSEDPEVCTWRATEYCRYAIKQGKIPIASHLIYPQILDNKKAQERDLGCQFGLSILERCDEMWVFSKGRNLSDGMKREIWYAKTNGIHIRYVDVGGKEWQER